MKANYGKEIKDIMVFFKFEQEIEKKDVSIGYFNHRLFKGNGQKLNTGLFRERLTYNGIQIPLLVESKVEKVILNQKKRNYQK